MQLVYSLGRCVLRVTGTAVRRWDLGGQRPIVEPLAFKGEVVLIGDRLNLRTVDLGKDSGWSNLMLDLDLADDGRLTGVSRTSTGELSEGVLAVVKGFVAGVTALDPAGRQMPKPGSEAVGESDNETPQATAIASSGGADSSARSTSEAAPDEEASTDAETQDSEKDPTPDGTDDESPDADAPPASTSEAAADEEASTDAEAHDSEKDPTPDGTDDESPEAALETPDFTKPMGWLSPAVWSQYLDENRDAAITATALDRHLDHLLKQLPDEPSALATKLEAVAKVREQLAKLQEDFERWVIDRQDATTAEYLYDLELWDLPVDTSYAKWKGAAGRTSIEDALSSLAPSTRPTNSPARRDTRDAVLALFRQFGVVFAVNQLTREGEDVDGNEVTDAEDLKEPTEASPPSDHQGLQYRRPYPISLSCYRLSPGPDGQARLELCESRSVTVVSEVSALAQLDFSDVNVGENKLAVTFGTFGGPKSLSIVSPAEKAELAKAVGGWIEAAAPVARLATRVPGGWRGMWADEVGARPPAATSSEHTTFEQELDRLVAARTGTSSGARPR